MNDILFLFGAGASVKAEPDSRSVCPPLGSKLFDELNSFEDEKPTNSENIWKKYESCFRDCSTFEEGFVRVQKESKFNQTDYLFRMQKSMALYFNQFSPSPENLYLKFLKKTLRTTESNIRVFTLNYDMLLQRSFLHLSQLEQQIISQSKIVALHGCPNYYNDTFSPIGFANEEALNTSSITDVIFTGNMTPSMALSRTYTLNGKDIEKDIRIRGCHPMIAYYAPGKSSEYGPDFYDGLNVIFKKNILKVKKLLSLVFIPLLNQTHTYGNPS